MTLIEVLVAVLILSFGLLGLVGLQSRASAISAGAEDSNNAALLGNEIATTMVLNQTPAGLFDTTSTSAAASAASTASTKLPNGAAAITYDTTSKQATIAINWKPPSAASDGGVGQLHDAGGVAVSRGNGRPAGAGFSLIELLVSMAIGLIVTLAVTTVMVNGESNKRSTTSVNDINQSGSYAAYMLDRQIRSAGSSFAAKFADVVGCTLYAQNSVGQVLPRAASFTASSPFQHWSAPAASAVPIRLAPIIVGRGYADTGTIGTQVRGDVLMVMTGTGGFEEVPQPILAAVLPGSLRLANTLGYRVGDLVLLSDAAAGNRCMVEQLSAVQAGGQQLSFGGSYYTQTIGPADATNYGTSSSLAQIGNYNANLPQFSLIGVGDNATLYSNDLLPAAAVDDIGQPVADGVVELRAVYGVVPSSSVSVPISWVSPAATNYTPGAITPKTLRSIVAIRLGLILRTSLYEKDYTAPGTLQLFADLPAAAQPPARTITGTDLHYRYRTVEVTIPLTNVMSAPWPP